MQAKFEEIVSLTDTFCQEHLNDEYAQLCRKLATLGRNVLHLNDWWLTLGCGIVHALGKVN